MTLVERLRGLVDSAPWPAGIAITKAINEIDRLTAENERLREAVPNWRTDGSMPGIPVGASRPFIVAIRRERNGKVYSFPALYLNAFPLDYEQDEEWDKPTTGWFRAEANDDGDGARYMPLYLAAGDEFVAWCDVPDYSAALEQP